MGNKGKSMIRTINDSKYTDQAMIKKFGASSENKKSQQSSKDKK